LGSELRSRTGQILSALGLAAISPEVADAARKSQRRSDNQEGNNDQARDNPDNRGANSQNEQESNRKNEASAEDRNTSDKSEKSGNSDRTEERRANDESSDQDNAESGKDRGQTSRRNGDSDSSSRESSSADDHSAHHGGRHVREFQQQADEPVADAPADDVPDTTTVTPANPNVVISDVPDTSANDLIVQANDNVIATVSSSGGFAFARSGGVTAVTGPDGASIIQTGEVTSGTDGTNPTEPSDDGGNNDLDFTS